MPPRTLSVLVVMFACGCKGGPGTHSISGAVSGLVLAGVTIGLSGASTASTTTDATGAYAFHGLANGSYAVTPSLPGYVFSPASAPVTVSGGDVIGQDFTVTAAAPDIKCLWPAHATAGADGVELQIIGAGFGQSAVGLWNGAPRPTRVVSSEELGVTIASADLAAAGSAQVAAIAAAGGPPSAAMSFVIAPANKPRVRVPHAALFVSFERRTFPSEWGQGQILQQWTQYDTFVGRTVAEEVSAQLDSIHALGVDTISFALRASDSETGNPFIPPDCPEPYALGLHWPVPLSDELSHLVSLLDLLQAKGMRMQLGLANNRAEESPPIKNRQWLDAIFGAVKGHPALDVILLNGNPRLAPDRVPATCNMPGEPALFMGPDSPAAAYVQWAIGYALAFGFPARQVSAQATTGTWVVDSEGPNEFMNDGHFWRPIRTLKILFDRLGIPDEQRTYALSVYERRKCFDWHPGACDDLPPHQWTDDTLRGVFQTIGRCTAARVIAPEMGYLDPVEASWKTEWAVESLTALFERHGIESAAFWRWTHEANEQDRDRTSADPVKWRGAEFRYAPVAKEIVDMASDHLPLVANGSFELPADGGSAPEAWTLTGSAGRLDLAAEGGPTVPTRGRWALRLDTSTSPSAAAISAPVAAIAGHAYVVVMNLRFSFLGDPDTGAAPEARPQVYLAVEYLNAAGERSALRPRDTARYFQEDSTSGFETKVLSFAPPADAAAARVVLGVERRALAAPLIADFDVVR